MIAYLYTCKRGILCATARWKDTGMGREEIWPRGQKWLSDHEELLTLKEAVAVGMDRGPRNTRARSVNALDERLHGLAKWSPLLSGNR
ncbi:MAG: hypothetical protein PVF93_06125 [Chromatiaceae bacterium]|jgi:hypothetical protein